MSAQKTKAAFIEPMLLLRTERLPEGANWAYELKLDGYRAMTIKTSGTVHLRSRNDNDFNGRYPAVVQALSWLPDETVIDGEVVALDESGRPSFNTLQNYGSSKAPVFYYVFDVLILAGRNVISEPLPKLVLVWRWFLTHDLFGDRLTPCLFKHQTINAAAEVVDSDLANATGSCVRRGNRAPSRAKFR